MGVAILDVARVDVAGWMDLSELTHYIYLREPSSRDIDTESVNRGAQVALTAIPILSREFEQSMMQYLRALKALALQGCQRPRLLIYDKKYG